ncbi:MAG: glycogen synthase GlgA [Deltaproteobacteria bacterium]|nr:glycogen synthase GlgA [Deltaproteobacteria bacterium]
MKILFVSSEVAPFAKTGGLGDVGAALPRALRAAGHDVRIVMPCYRRVLEGNHRLRMVIPPMTIAVGPARLSFDTLEATLPGSDVPVYLVRCPRLYDRPNVYTQDGDEHLRFALLNWAALRIAQQLGFAPDIVHANDWQTALLPLMLKTVFAWDRLFANARSVLTIHNIGHQGTFPASAVNEVGLGMTAQSFHQEQLAQGRMSFMLTGLLYANAITTVSPTYAREIQTPEHGVGLDAFLRARRDVLFGILNGIDDDEWNPAKDRHLPHRYELSDLSGKARNKEALLTELRLPQRPGVPLVGMVTRLAWQKGLDLCFEALPALFMQRDVQLVVLGSGEPKYEAFFSELARRLPRRVAFINRFSEPMAHLIEAASDMFLMPSRYEPCGLNQMYSLAYGTPPIVHRTGGLADTVKQFNPATGEGNGFVFDHFDVRGLKWALGAAVDAYRGGRGWTRLVQNGMAERFGWALRVREYEAVYRGVAPYLD